MSAIDDTKVIEGFTWAETPDDYYRLTPGWRENVIPVLLPPQSYRRERWSRILGWYGLGEAKPINVLPSEAPILESGDPIFVCDESVLPPIQMYASFCGRPYFLVEDDNKIHDICSAHSVRSALIVDHPDRFHFDRLLGFHNRLDVQWGILTAQDIPGLTFSIAKLMAGQTQCPKSFCALDMLGQEIRVFSDGHWTQESSESNTEALLEVTSRRDWDGFAIMAHGDAGHTSLWTVVLCGVPLAQEHNQDGQLSYGCLHPPDEEGHCKRAPELGAAIARYSEIRAREVYLFTCSGFCTSQQQYPSNVSSVLGCSEGFAHTVLTTDGLTQIFQYSDKITFSLRRKGFSVTQLRTLFNDLAMRRTGRTPYIIWGDPRGPEPDWEFSDSQGTVYSSDSDSALVVKLDGLGDASVLLLEETEPATHLLRGQHYAAIVRSPDFGDSRYTLSNATDRWAQHESGLKSALGRVRRASWAERALRNLLEEHIENSQALADRILELMSLRLHLEFTVQSALTICGRIQRQGTYDIEMERATDNISQLMARWDRWFCEIVLENLLSERYDRLLSDGCSEIQLSESEPCSRCRSTVFERLLSHPVEESSLVHEQHCPVCGYLGAWTLESGRLRVRIPTSVQRGNILDITLHSEESTQDMWSSRLKGEIAVKAHDGWCHGVYLETVESIDEWPYHISVEIPASIAPELMSLNFCSSRALDVRFARIRCAAVGQETPTSESNEKTP